MVSAWKFIIVTNTIKLQVCHWRRACRDDRKESSFLLEWKDYSSGKLSCISLPSGYDATVLWGRVVWATILNTSWAAKKQECLAAVNIEQEGMAKKRGKKRGVVNRTNVWMFYCLYAYRQRTAWMDVYHRASKRWLDSFQAAWIRSMVAWWSPGLTCRGKWRAKHFFKSCFRPKEEGWLEIWAW